MAKLLGYLLALVVVLYVLHLVLVMLAPVLPVIGGLLFVVLLMVGFMKVKRQRL